MVTSGVRIGTPALTTRGMKEAEMATVGGLIVEALDHPTDEAVLSARGGRCTSSRGASRSTRAGCAEAPGSRGTRMRCPFCKRDDSKVLDSRESAEGTVTRRRRECLGCTSASPPTSGSRS
jgi:hypothetical protein